MRVLRCSDMFSYGIFLAEMVTLTSPSCVTCITSVKVIEDTMNSDGPIRDIEPMLVRSGHEDQVIRVITRIRTFRNDTCCH